MNRSAVTALTCLAGGLLTGLAPPLPAQAASKPKTITYYIAADHVTWDYAPSGTNQINGQPFDEMAQMFVQSGPERIGKVYRKSLFREYTDASFKTLKPRPRAWQHLGLLGPLIRAEVGDTIQVVFRNNTAYAASVHPHGVFYTKSSEGAGAADQTAGAEKADDAVPPGGTHTYVWPVPERAGPASGDLSSVSWMYHSHVNEDRDLNSGLMGPMIISRRGATKPDGTPKDVDRELVVAFFELDENMSWHFDHNLNTYTTAKPKVTPDMLVFFHPFGLSNFKESLNGFLFGHLPGLTTRVGERVRWYLMASTNFEVHAAHWHGNTVVINHMRTDVAPLATMGMVVADMVPDNPGTWLFHCHVREHLNAGMQSLYTVLPAAASLR